VRLVKAYTEGSSVAAVAAEYSVDRRTVAAHLERHGVARRGNSKHKLSPEDVVEATGLYRAGGSLAAVGRHLGVAPATVRKELIRAGIDLRNRSGWRRPRSSRRQNQPCPKGLGVEAAGLKIRVAPEIS
jgi:transposase-like protein